MSRQPLRKGFGAGATSAVSTVVLACFLLSEKALDPGSMLIFTGLLIVLFGITFWAWTLQ